MFEEPYEIPQPDHYTFVYEEPNNGWWLKLDSIDKIGDYHKKVESMYGECFMDYVHHYEEYQQTGDYRVFDKTRTFAIVRFAEDRHLTMLDAIIQFRLMIVSQQCEAVRKFGYILVNSVGGYHSGPTVYSQLVHRKTFTWPDFKKSDIRISQWPGGTHWYVHIGDMELHQDDEIKWNTREEAEKAAMKYVNQED